MSPLRAILLLVVSAALCTPTGTAAAASVSGTVTTAGGAPVSGALIVADAGAGFHNATSDGAGHFAFAGGLPAGSYHLQASQAGYAASNYWSLSVAASGSQAVAFTLRPGGGAITGQVLDQSGTPVAGATVDAWQHTASVYDDGAWGHATADGSGHFTIAAPAWPGGLATGTYFLKATKAGLPDGVLDDIAVTAGQTTSGITLTQVGGTSSLVGHVRVLGGTPVAGARVYVESPLAAALGTTDGTGLYGIGNLPAGSYHAVITATGYAAAHRYNVTVPDGTVVAGLDFWLDTAMGSVTGLVTDAGSGTPIAGATVFADSDQGDGWGRTTTAADGTYTLTGLAPMLYYVHATMTGYAGQLKTTTVVASTTVSSMDFPLGVAGGAVAGRVTAGGHAVAGASVFVNSSAGEPVTVSTNCTTGSDGRFHCDNLSAGQYDVHVFGVQGYANQVRYFVDVPGSATANGVDFALANGAATIRGTVYAPGGAPLAGAKVQAFQEQNPGTWASMTTDDQGRYQFDQLWGGTTYLVFADLAGYAQIRREHVPVSSSGITVVDLPDQGTSSDPCAGVAQSTDPAPTMARATIVMHGPRSGTFKLSGHLPGATLDASAPITFAMTTGPGLLCTDLPAKSFTRRRKTVVLQRGRKAQGVASIRLVHNATGLVFLVRGRSSELAGGQLPTTTLGFDVGGTRVGGPATLQQR